MDGFKVLEFDDAIQLTKNSQMYNGEDYTTIIRIWKKSKSIEMLSFVGNGEQGKCETELSIKELDEIYRKIKEIEGEK